MKKPYPRVIMSNGLFLHDRDPGWVKRPKDAWILSKQKAEDQIKRLHALGWTSAKVIILNPETNAFFQWAVEVTSKK